MHISIDATADERCVDVSFAAPRAPRPAPSPPAPPASSTRSLFHRLLNAEGAEIEGALRSALSLVDGEHAAVEDDPVVCGLTAGTPWPSSPSSSSSALAPSLDTLRQYAAGLRRAAISRLAAARTRLQGLGADRLAAVIAAFAPVGLTDGCWLQRAYDAATGHSEIGGRLLRLHAGEIGDGDPRRHHANQFRTLLEVAGVHLPAVTSWQFCEAPGPAAPAFERAAFLLSLAELPRAYLPELLGQTLYYYASGLCPALVAAGERCAGPDLELLAAHRVTDAADDRAQLAIEAVHLYLAEARRRRGEQGALACWRRIWRGVALAERQERALDAALLRIAGAREPTPREAMLALFRAKAPYARGYHGDAAVGGRRLDEWMDLERSDPEQFLDALAQSPLIRAGASEQSAFPTTLTSFHGPMFRVFSPDELAIIARWIDSLPAGAAATGLEAARVRNDNAGTVGETAGQGRGDAGLAAAPAAEPVLRRGPRLRPPAARAVTAARARPSWRELFHQLVNIELHPEAIPHAERYVALMLDRCRSRRRRSPHRLLDLPSYDPIALQQHVDAYHRTLVDSYRPLTGPIALSREDVMFIARQFGVWALVDGAWLQHASRAGLGHTPVTAKLFHIYSDELGNGHPELNHCNVMRDLLAEFGSPVAPTDSLALCQDPQFVDEAFEAAIGSLAITLFPRRYLPELLGHTLRIEIFALGNAYMRDAQLLRHHGFSSLFLDLHNTIDNASTGHTRWAVDAIKLHLDEVRELGGQPLVDEHWRRIQDGTYYYAMTNARLWRRILRTVGPGYVARRARDTLGQLRRWARAAARRSPPTAA